MNPKTGMTETEQDFILWTEKRLGGAVIAIKEAFGDQSTVFKIHATNGDYFLKIGLNLVRERERLDWLNGKLPVPRVVGFTEIDGKEAILLSAIEGVNLAVLSKEWSVEKVMDRLVSALHQFHAADVRGCPFGSPGPNKVLVHGDACLPNLIFRGDNFSGYIDLGEMGVDTPEVDFAAAIWSLQYNLGPGYGLKFLEKYGGKDATEEFVEELRLRFMNRPRI